MYHDGPLIREFVAWLSATPASHWLQSVSSRVPVLLAAVQTLHLLAMSVVIAANGFVALGLLGRFKAGDPVESLPRRCLPWVTNALWVMLATGLILVVRWPSRILLSATFLPKLVLVAFGTGLLFYIARASNQRDGLESRTPAATFLAVLLLLVWTGAVIAGRWIPFA
jgi:hypothetical protein